MSNAVHPYHNLSFTVENANFHMLNMIHFLFKHSLPSHSHGSNVYEIHYISSGYGKLKIGETFYDLKPNTLYVNGPHVVHAQAPLAEDPMCEYCVYLKLDSYKKSKNQTSAIVEHFQNHPFWIGEDTQNILPLMQQLFFEMERQYLGYEETMRSLLCQLIISTVRNYQDVGNADPVFTSASFIDTKPVIIDDYFLYEYQTLSLDDLSSRLGLSPRQTERYLKEHYGKTFVQKKTESKMSTAALLLSDPTLNITAISDELGYSSIEHFSTAFKRYYKCSPSEYRKKITL